ncbi:MAG: bifunctional UDP-N-acetylglucosamine diphosphorylase/glucosamine-1-phosphate N-acetyltransferase GlmU [Pseudomonadota bacterium]|nr:bifunctional UDP-N-acetylglucosamine diphosphorylase/glucosamine-1-phosphate N-acetyltransferase GlmU [Pseudomonadota bacterium]MEC8461191.1 bifunctional UDP-N-acetylglucosamine diphosphorylase/glucosamine-1-phosphate N-acetyltransferase GlmU [Pseudomonadota bacterium]
MNLSRSDVSTVVLAAGRSSRMKTNIPKCLLDFAGRPLISRVCEAAYELQTSSVVLVHREQDYEAMSKALDLCSKNNPVWLSQQDSLGYGTGVALLSALKVVKTAYCLVLLGDVPALCVETLKSFVDQACQQGTVSVLSAIKQDPGAYGRILRQDDGQCVAIREAAHLTKNQLRITEVNTGILFLPVAFARATLSEMVKVNLGSEVYLTDLVEKAYKQGLMPTAFPCDQEKAWCFWGVNTLCEITRLQKLYYRNQAKKLLEQGVWVMDPSRFVCAGTLYCEPGVVIDEDVSIYGVVYVKTDARIGKGAIINNSIIGKGAEVLPYSIVEKTRLGASVRVGPFAYCRGHTDIEDSAQVGCFVETKNTRVGRATTAKHLAYLGDLTIEEGVNIGAGVIHCNYDGLKKHHSVVKKHAFIGADTQLIGPVSIGEQSVVGAGTTVVEDVPDKTLAISRVRQQTKSRKSKQVLDV